MVVVQLTRICLPSSGIDFADALLPSHLVLNKVVFHSTLICLPSTGTDFVAVLLL